MVRRRSKRIAPAKKAGNKTKRHSVLTYLMWGLLALVFALASLATYQKYKLMHRPMPKILPETVRGIDVSHYQEQIDWAAVAAYQPFGNPVRFAFIKATEGIDIDDEYFEYNFWQARKHGIMRGAYHVLSSKSSVTEQAEHFCNTVNLQDNDMIPVLDIEGLGDYKPEQLRMAVLRWMNIVEHHYGVIPMIYTSFSFKMNYLNGPEFARYPYWIAHYYVSKLKYTGEWQFWQFTDVGHVDGIRGYVDMNIYNGTVEELENITIKRCRYTK